MANNWKQNLLGASVVSIVLVGTVVGCIALFAPSASDQPPQDDAVAREFQKQIDRACGTDQRSKAYFHCTLDMIEKRERAENVANGKRVEDNKPFRSIRVEFKEASAVLPTVDWSRRSFIWLDYDDQITPDALLDARTVSSHAFSGSLFAISVQCHKAREIIEASRDIQVNAVDRFRSRFGRQRVPQDVMEDQLNGWSFGELSRSMMAAEIEDALASRNLQLAEDDKIVFEPICDFQYADNAKMTTIVGMFVAKQDRQKFRDCHFRALDFMPKSGRLVDIKMPVLTIREIRNLEKQLPKASADAWQLGSIPLGQAKQYAAFYRYFPNFAVVEP